MSLIKGVFWLIVFAVLLAIIGRIFFFEVAKTSAYSMIPNIMPGDTFLVLTRGTLGPGEVAMCTDPENPEQMVVGRILGVPGSTFEMSANQLILNGQRIDHEFDDPTLIYEDNTGGEHTEYSIGVALEKVSGRVYHVALMDRAGNRNYRKTEVESGFFIVGDNRNRSRDSRNFGEIPIGDCIGSPFLVVWPGPDNGDFKFKHRFLQWIH